MFKPVYGQLGTTFGGNHLACSAALAVMDVIEQDNLVENAQLLFYNVFLDNFDKKIAIFSFNYYNKKRHPVSSINLPDVFMRENQERSEHNGKPES